jgi:hypothetical protein
VLGQCCCKPNVILRKQINKDRIDGVLMGNPNDLAQTWGMEIIDKEFDHLRNIV